MWRVSLISQCTCFQCFVPTPFPFSVWGRNFFLIYWRILCYSSHALRTCVDPWSPVSSSMGKSHWFLYILKPCSYNFFTTFCILLDLHCVVNCCNNPCLWVVLTDIYSWTGRFFLILINRKVTNLMETKTCKCLIFEFCFLSGTLQS